MLSEMGDASASYTYVGDEGYVRAKIIESNGRMAWVQPVSVSRASTRREPGTRWHDGVLGPRKVGSEHIGFMG